MRIITAATSEPVTLEQARKQCRVDAELSGSPPTLSHEDDELLVIFMTAAREWVEAYLGLVIAPTMVAFNLSTFPVGSIALESGPVIGPVVITYLDALGAAQVVDDTTYVLDTTDAIAKARLVGDASWPTTDGSEDNITVSYSIGYSAAGDSPQDTPLPKSIKVAILLLTAHLYKNREASVEAALTEIPMGVTFFLGPIKWKRSFA